MTGMSDIQYDMSNLSEKISELGGALLGRGASLGDLQQLLRIETGQMAARIGDSLGPKNKKSYRSMIKSEVRPHLTSVPMDTNIDDKHSRNSKKSGFTWLIAGPEYLVGINDEDNLVGIDGESALKLLRASQKNKSRGDDYVNIGSRGSQDVKRLNRIRISRQSYNYILSTIEQRFGKLRACFYRVALEYIPNKRVPAFVKKKVPAMISSGKSTLNESLVGGADQSFIEFGVTAPGVGGSNAKITAKISGAVDRSSKVLIEKVRKILNGYSYDWKTGGVFYSRVKDISEEADT